jgi:hypothetical protein
MVRAANEARYFGMTTRLTTSIKTVADHSADIIAAIKELKRNQVLVGVPAAKAPRDPAEAHGSPINNAALAYIHDNGSPTQNIPARPFLHTGIKLGQAQIEDGLKRAANAAFDGNLNQMRKDLTRTGLAATTAVKMKINTGPFAPLGESTLAARRRRGRTGTRPLIDTGQLRNSINFVIRRK